MNCYVYCLCADLEEETLQDLPGIDGTRPCRHRCGGLIAVVSWIEAAHVALNRARLQDHERVLQRVLNLTTPLPFRFGTVVSPSQLEEFVTGNRSELVSRLESVEGCVEMSVRIASLASPEPAPESLPPSEPDPAEKKPGPGLAYLEGKKRAYQEEEGRRRGSEEIARWLDRGIAGFVRATQTRFHSQGTLKISVAHLVNRGQLQAYREALEGLRRENRELRFLVSGPWPPYSFVGTGKGALSRLNEALQ